MPQYTRAVYRGGTYFFTLVTFERRPFLTTPLARRCLRSAWREAAGKWPFYLHALCLLPDHLHCILTLPEQDSNYSLRWRRMKGIFTRLYRREENIEEIPQSLSRVKRGEMPVWQRRFWEHVIRDDEDLRRHVEYIHYNPVKHGYAKHAVDYPWSTFRRYVQKGLYACDWGGNEEDLSAVGSACE
jgi:putative transposase